MNQRGTQPMKTILWMVVVLLVTALVFWLLTIPGVPRNPFLMLLIVPIFVIPPIGAFWMLYMAIRHERQPLPMMLLALVPDTFLWYYFERIRFKNRGHAERSQA
jgi:hypothetical protein